MICDETSNSTRFLVEEDASCNHTIAEPADVLSARAGRGCRAKNDTVAARNRVVARLITASVWHETRRIGIALFIFAGFEEALFTAVGAPNLSKNNKAGPRQQAGSSKMVVDSSCFHQQGSLFHRTLSE